MWEVISEVTMYVVLAIFVGLAAVMIVAVLAARGGDDDPTV